MCQRSFRPPFDQQVGNSDNQDNDYEPQNGNIVHLEPFPPSIIARRGGGERLGGGENFGDPGEYLGKHNLVNHVFGCFIFEVNSLRG
jgi:hypothetical protein